MQCLYPKFRFSKNPLTSDVLLASPTSPTRKCQIVLQDCYRNCPTRSDKLKGIDGVFHSGNGSYDSNFDEYLNITIRRPAIDVKFVRY